MDDDLFDDELPSCPACYGNEVRQISDDDKTHALGLYDLYDFIGRINIMTNNFRCLKCGYEF